MTVQTYVEIRKKELDSFAEFWEEKMKENPENFPKTFEEVYEWEMQEESYNELLSIP